MGSICKFFEDKPAPVNSRQTGGKGGSGVSFTWVSCPAVNDGPADVQA